MDERQKEGQSGTQLGMTLWMSLLTFLFHEKVNFKNFINLSEMVLEHHIMCIYNLLKTCARYMHEHKIIQLKKMEIYSSEK